MSQKDILLQVDDLKVYFPIRKGFLRRTAGFVKAVDGVSFFIREGETLGLVGESGCGKTTVGRSIVRLVEPTAGSVNFNRKGTMDNILEYERSAMKEIRKEIQIIFQDPYSSLDPRMPVRDIITQPLDIHQIGTRRERTEQAKELMERVGLSAYHMNRYPHQFSGGQRQRLGIARALTLNPKLIVCDEPVSALDVSVQAQVLNMLEDLQDEFGLTYLFVAHDLGVVEHISDRIMVMYLGKIVEIAPAETIYLEPAHPYTEALLGSIPSGDPRSDRKRRPLGGTVPDPSNPPVGCNFNTRCPYATDLCHREEPELKLRTGSEEQYVACHYAADLNLRSFYGDS